MAQWSLKLILKKVFYWFLIISLISIVFFIIIFPTDDLGDYASIKVSEVTDNKVFLQFNKFGLGILPPALTFEEVFVEAPLLSGITVRELTLHPSLTSLITKQPSGSVKAEGIFDGALKLQIKKGTPTDNSPERQRLIVEAEQIQLKAVNDSLKLPIRMNGKLDLTADLQADLNSQETPEMDMQIHLDEFVLPTSTVNTMMGPLNLPEMRLGKINLKGRLSGGQFVIEQGDVGASNKDELYGKIKGKLNMGMNPSQGFATIFGPYEFEIDLSANKNFQNKAGLFLSFLESYKTMNGENARFHFKVSSNSMDAPPNITPAR